MVHRLKSANAEVPRPSISSAPISEIDKKCVRWWRAHHCAQMAAFNARLKYNMGQPTKPIANSTRVVLGQTGQPGEILQCTSVYIIMIISRQTQYGCQARVACVQKWFHCRLNVANLFLVDIQTDFAMLSLAFSTLSICCLGKVDLWRTQRKKTKPPECNIASTGWRLFDIAWNLILFRFFNTRTSKDQASKARHIWNRLMLISFLEGLFN